MNFDFSEDQRLLQKTARDFLAERSPLAANREVLESPSKKYHEGLWKGVAEMGWLGAAVPEAYGGAGFGRLELVLIAEEIGRALAPIPFSSSVYLATEGLLLAGKDDQKKRWLPKLAAGEVIGTFALAEKAGQTGPNGIQAKLTNGKLSGTKAPVLDGEVAGLALVAAREGSGISLALVDLSGPGVERTPIESIDPSRSMAQLTFKDAPAELVGGSGAGWALAEQLLDRAAVLVAFEQIGAGDRALEITRDYAMGRYAFGRPIASFQALKHRLADLWAALQLARSNCFYGAWALENASDELGVAACSARVSATDASVLAAEEMIQMHGGVGYTWEYDCHLFYRRAKLLQHALGTPRVWREKLIQRLDARRAA
jgi:alkylation response protein AidB-like acyl-CoA dehydrogenase